MGVLNVLRGLFGGGSDGFPAGRFDLAELCRRLDAPVGGLAAVRPVYAAHSIPKRNGRGSRTIHVPDAATKTLQRRILRRVLGRLRAHAAATGFERGRSILDNARPHVGQAVLVKLDVRDFFPSTSTDRVRALFRSLGWDAESADTLVRLCTLDGGLPQGAPTSPRLANLANVRLDARLAALAARHGAAYTRYADDLTFSFPADDRSAVHQVIGMAKMIVGDEGGYRLHQKRKLQIRRRHEQQLVTGLVVNERVQLPRRVRRWLRAVEHHVATGRDASLTPEQLAGWRAFAGMVERDGGRG
jgi:hypothetical protein